ncbi:MAG: hypothetical protein M3Y42_01080 [Actinomycetota bacterium]|nr:hypothetical protein [Actinomycetota bacterium]MDQ2955542.1 hypothetical protein [Actinomycetota bacterium]
MTLALPDSLQPWAVELGALDIDLAIALGPLIRRLDPALTGHEQVAGPTGELNGYDGITRRGDPSRILLSEWAVAEVLPEEFLRRLASAELLHTAPAYQRPADRGRVAVLLDVGPDTLGAVRLAQLAALIVLHRQAAARGSELSIGFFGDEPGQWRTGPIEELLATWLQARRVRSATPEELAQWLEPEAAPADVWLFGGQRCARSAPGRARCLVGRDSRWDAAGVTAIEVLIDGRTLLLPVPRRDLSIRALRGAGFRHLPTPPVTITGALRFPFFPSSSSRILGRGEGPDELVTIPVRAGSPGRLRRHRFAGPVAFAGFLGRRVIAFVVMNGALRFEVVGKPLIELANLELPLSRLPELPDPDGPIAPLVFGRGSLFGLFADGWHRVNYTSGFHRKPLVDLRPGRRNDAPELAWRTPDGDIIATDGRRLGRPDRLLLGPHRDFLSSPDGLDWTHAPVRFQLRVANPAEVLGQILIGGDTAVVTRSSEGEVELHRREGRQPLSQWSGGHWAAVHPTLPWLVVQDHSGEVTVADLVANTTLMSIPVST